MGQLEFFFGLFQCFVFVIPIVEERTGIDPVCKRHFVTRPTINAGLIAGGDSSEDLAGHNLQRGVLAKLDRQNPALFGRLSYSRQ